MELINISGYKFVPLDNLQQLREQWLLTCYDIGLKGTILLGEEGTNQFLVGTRQQIDQFIDYMRQDPRLADITYRESPSDFMPFRKMRVKIKPEIVTMGVDELQVATDRSDHLSPEELREWFASGKDFTLLDTRNEFEVELGTFTGAEQLHINCFREFPESGSKLSQYDKEKPVVIFCTGGIRCEKAAPIMAREGFKEVYQLDGGILIYFVHCGGDFYEGDCFVFDDRITVDPALQPHAKFLCTSCQTVVTEANTTCENCSHLAEAACI